jgi:predicted alpha-1,6-mannanase (GH76 family)
MNALILVDLTFYRSFSTSTTPPRRTILRASETRTSTISQPPSYQDDARFLALGLGRSPKVFGFWRRTALGLSNLDGSGPKPVNSQAKTG